MAPVFTPGYNRGLLWNSPHPNAVRLRGFNALSQGFSALFGSGACVRRRSKHHIFVPLRERIRFVLLRFRSHY